jgi:hypothetical protein
MTLDPKARALVEAGRRAFRSTAVDRERIEAALRARLGDAALPPDAGVTQVATSASWPALTGAAIAVCVLAGGAFYALRPTPVAPVPDARPAMHRAIAQTTPADPAPQIPAAEPESAASTPSVVPPSPPSAASSPRTRDALAREVALLSRATSELRAGRPAAALKVLADHQRRFPTGALVEERRAAKAQALCLLGRVDEGRAELARLTPQSPAAATAQQVCDNAVPPAPDRK